MDRALLALCALCINALLAGPLSFYEALGLAGLFQAPAALLRSAERKLNREHRSLEERQWRGMVVTGALVLASLLIGFIFSRLSPFAELIILAIALPVRPTWDRASRLNKALAARHLPEARQALAGTAWRHHALLDDYGVARAGVEMLAVHFADKIIAPLFWYFLLGLPGFLASKALTLLDETLTTPGSGTRFAPGFGQAAQIAHFWLHYIPARIACALWLLVSICLSPPQNLQGNLQPLLAGFLSETPQGLALLGAASSLKLTLGGPLSLYGPQWHGEGSVKALPSDVKRALNVFVLLQLVLFAGLGLFI